MLLRGMAVFAAIPATFFGKWLLSDIATK